MAYTRKELQRMSIKQLKMIEKELSRNPLTNSRAADLNIETITIIVSEGNNFISFPYDLVDNTVEGLQNQNPNIPFNSIIGSMGNIMGGAGLFDNDGDGFMESGNLTTLIKESGYWLNIAGNNDGLPTSYELNFDIYPNIVDNPITYNLFSPPLQCGGNKIISYDGIDGAHPLDTLGARGAFVERIIGDGVALFNDCLTNYITEYNANAPYDPNNDMGPNQNSDVPNYIYDENTCWSGNLTSMKFGAGYWINLFCTTSEGQEYEYNPSNISTLYNNMGDEAPNFTTSYVGNFGNFQWLRKPSPTPKSMMTLTDSQVNDKIKNIDYDGRLTGNTKNIRRNTRPNLNRPVRN